MSASRILGEGPHVIFGGSETGNVARSEEDMQVRITDVPAGEAPEEVRQAWVGLVLPLAPGETGARTPRTVGVLTGPRGCAMALWYFLFAWGRRETGYVIDAQVAIELLAQKAPEAAAWWRKNAPHVLQPGRRFLFQAEACQEEF